jgi:ATP-dependent Clp protease ATP-binding subunit ClpB
LGEVLAAAGEEAQRLKDEYVSVEHVLLAMVDSGRRGGAGRLVVETRENVLHVLDGERLVGGKKQCAKHFLQIKSHCEK